MSELSLGTLSGLAANSFVVDVAAGSSLDLSNATGLPASALPAGSILQVVSTTKTDTFSASVAAGGLVSVTGFSASITPRSTSSKILVFVAIDGSASTADGHMAFRLMRGGSPVGVGDTAGSRTSLTASQTPAYASDNTALANAMKQFLDTPATTSTTTYSVEIHNSTLSSQTLYVNRSGADIDDAPRVRTISTITLMEVAG